MMLRGHLVEIFKGIKSFGAFLDFIEENEGAARGDFMTDDESELLEEAGGVLSLGEEILKLGLEVEINISDVIIIIGGELFDDVSFADLTSTFQNEGLAVFASFPGEEVLSNPSLHNLIIS